LEEIDRDREIKDKIMNQKFINDKYRKTRGGHSRFLDICCEKCGHHVCFYQKDGPGILKRMYKDRILGLKNTTKMVCPGCKQVLGVSIIYKKEKRPAFRLFVGAVVKKIVKSDLV